MHIALPRLQGAACISATCSGRRSSMLQGFGTSTWLCRKFAVSRSGVNNCIFYICHQYIISMETEIDKFTMEVLIGS